MKITGLKIFVANASRTNFVFVKLYTDDGIDGVGEATLEWRTKTVVGGARGTRALDRRPGPVRSRVPRRDAAPRFLLADRRGVPERARRDRGGAPRHQGQGARRAGLRAARRQAARPGQVLRQPLVLRRARRRTTIAARRKRAVAHGLPRAEMGPVRRPSGSRWTAPQRRRTIAIVEAVRDAVGPDIDLMLDVHGRLNVPTAIAMCRELARFDLAWIEEPTPPESIDALADVRAKSPVPIAAGERWFEPERFLEADRQARRRHPAARRLPPRRHAGDEEGRRPRPHALPAGRAAQSDRPGDERDDAASRGGDPELLDLRDGVDRRAVAEGAGARDRSRFDGGDIARADAPGLGVELNEEACARFPYEPYDVPIFTGDMNTRGVADGAAVVASRSDGPRRRRASACTSEGD